MAEYDEIKIESEEHKTELPEAPFLDGEKEPPQDKAPPSDEEAGGEFHQIDIEDEGWISLHRKIMNNEVFSESALYHLFSYCLLKANYKDTKIIFNGQLVSLKRGQFIASVKSIAKKLNLTIKQIRARLEILKRANMISIKRANRFSIITVLNYNTYQKHNQAKRQTENEAKGQTENGGQGQIEGKLKANRRQQIIIKNKTYVETDPAFQLASFFLGEIRKNKPDFREPNMQAWARDCDYMLRIDKLTVERCERVIRWVQADHGDGTGKWKGWASNVLSPGKLRDKFDELEMKMEESRPHPKGEDRGPKYEKVN